MKKIFSIYALACLLLTTASVTQKAHAQVVQMLHSNGNAAKNLIGTSTDTLSIQVSKTWSTISIQLVVTPSATTTHCYVTAKIYGSVNGNQYAQIGSTQFTGDSSSAVNSYIWPLANDRYLYYRIITTGASASSDTNSCTGFLCYKATAGVLTPQGGISTFTSSNVVTANTDKVTNTGTDTLDITIQGNHNCLSIQPVATKTSGTVLAGALLYVSNDGVNYIATGDSLHLTNVSTAQSAIWFIPATTTQYQYLRILTKGYTGTQVVGVTAKVLGK